MQRLIANSKMSTYKCPKCETEFILGTKFCQSCGYNLATEFIETPTCPKCEKTFPTSTIFCNEDGTRLVSPEKMIPKCIKCEKVYTDGTKFCPLDGGKVVPEALRTGIDFDNAKEFVAESIDKGKELLNEYTDKGNKFFTRLSKNQQYGVIVGGIALLVLVILLASGLPAGFQFLILIAAIAAVILAVQRPTKNNNKEMATEQKKDTVSLSATSDTSRAKLTTNRGFWLTLLLLIVTFGIYGWYLIYAFAKETNIACAEDNKHTRGLLAYVLFSLITFGIYAIVWHCQRINRCNNYLARNGKPEGLQLSTFLLTLFLFGWLTLGIMHLVVFCKNLYLQNAVNSTYNELNSL